jgi:hypothetical protein
MGYGGEEQSLTNRMAPWAFHVKKRIASYSCLKWTICEVSPAALAARGGHAK